MLINVSSIDKGIEIFAISATLSIAISIVLSFINSLTIIPQEKQTTFCKV